MKLRVWLLLAAALVATPCLVHADEHEAEAEAEEALNETHGASLSLREIVSGEEALQFWGAVVNFALLVYLIRRMGKKPVQAFLKQRSDVIAQGIVEAAELKRSAEAVFQEYSERMNTLDRELAKLRQDVAQAAERDRARIVAEAEESVERLKAETAALVSRQAEQLEAQIRREVVAAAVEAAERAVRENASPDDQQRLADAFLRELEKTNKPGTHSAAPRQKPSQAPRERVA